MPDPITDEQRAQIRQRLAYANELLTTSEMQDINPWLYVREYAGDVTALLADNERLIARDAAMRQILSGLEPLILIVSEFSPGTGRTRCTCADCGATGQHNAEITHADTCILVKSRALLEASQ
jgi:hypothetical protein